MVKIDFAQLLNYPLLHVATWHTPGFTPNCKNQFRIDSTWRGHFGWHDQSVLPKELRLCKINTKFYRYFLTTLKWPVRVILGSPAPSKNTNSALQVLVGYCWVGWLWVFPKGIIFFQRWQLQMSLLKSAHFSGKLRTTACGNGNYRKHLFHPFFVVVTVPEPPLIIVPFCRRENWGLAILSNLPSMS